MGMPSVAIITINWNNRNDTIDCLRSLDKINYRNYTVIIVDNGSTDDSVTEIRKAYPGVEILEMNRNTGFTGGNNAGMAYALEKGFDYVLLLNNDTIVDPLFLDRLVDVAQTDSKIGVVGPKILYFYDPGRIWYLGGKINYWSGETSLVGSNEIDNGKYADPADTDLINGCALLVKSEVLKRVGLLYDPMFCYLEENDFCARVKKHGYRLVYVPGSIIWHKVAGSSGKLKVFQLFYFTRNRLIFMRRNARPVQLLFFLPYYFARHVLYQLVLMLARLNIGRARMILRAVYEGITA